MRDDGDDDADFAVSVARQEARRRQGALLVLRECCHRAGRAADELRRAEQERLERGLDALVHEPVLGARRRLARALRALEAAPALIGAPLRVDSGGRPVRPVGPWGANRHGRACRGEDGWRGG